MQLLTGGIDPNRTFYYDSLTANTGNRGSGTGTAGGHAYRNGPFIITFREGLQGQPTAADITGVLVNPAHSELVAPLQQMFPNLAIRDYNGVSRSAKARRLPLAPSWTVCPMWLLRLDRSAKLMLRKLGLNLLPHRQRAKAQQST